MSDLVRAGRRAGAPRIGPGIAARLGELVETGSIAELDEPRASGPAGARRLRAPAWHRAAAHGRDRAGARRAHRRRVPGRCARGQPPLGAGIGPKTEARILERLGSRTARARGAGYCSTARGLSWRTSPSRSEERSPATPADGRTRASTLLSSSRLRARRRVLDAFERLPSIVAVVERAHGELSESPSRASPWSSLLPRRRPSGRSSSCDGHTRVRRGAGAAPRTPDEEGVFARP